MLSWISAIGANMSAQIILVIDSLHHYRSLSNCDDFRFWEYQKC